MSKNKLFNPIGDAERFGRYLQPMGTNPDVVANVENNMQLGWHVNLPSLDAATPLVFNPAVVIVMTTPRMYDGNLPMKIAIKELLESHAKGVSGIDIEYANSHDTGTPVGHDGQNIPVPGKTTRSQQSPSFTFTELSGNIVYDVFRKWTFDMNHPDMYAAFTGTDYDGPWTASAYSASFMVIQYDPTLRPDRIIGAAYYCNVIPQGPGPMGVERTLGTSAPKERSITFSAIQVENPYVMDMAYTLAKNMNLQTYSREVAKGGLIPTETKDDTRFGDYLTNNFPFKHEDASVKR